MARHNPNAQFPAISKSVYGRGVISQSHFSNKRNRGIDTFNMTAEKLGVFFKKRRENRENVLDNCE